MASVIINYDSTIPSHHCLFISSCGDGGVVSCTRRACIDPCSLPPEAGPCRASIQAFYYDQDEDKCFPFTYGGCGGNDNKFESVKDCLLRCDPDSNYPLIIIISYVCSTPVLPLMLPYLKQKSCTYVYCVHPWLQ